MDDILPFVLRVLDLLTFGWFSGAGRSTDVDRNADRPDEGLATIGRTGMSFTPLRPSGKIEIDGRRYDAASEGRLIDAGTTVEIVGWSGFLMIVRERKRVS
jgi:membrane-bound ClpP family serine protease